MADIISIKFKVDGKEITATEKDLKDLQKATKQVEGGSKKAEGSISGMGKAMAGLVTLAAAKELADFAIASVRAAKEIDNLARLTGMSAESFQRQAFAAKQVGIESDKYADIIKDVNDKIGDFMVSGAGPLVDFFDTVGKKVGVTIDDFRGLSGDQALGLYVKTLEDANVSQQEMTFFMEALASDATALAPLFANNAKKLNEFGDAAGDVLSEETIGKASELDRIFNEMSNTIGNKLKSGIIDATFALAEFFQVTEDTKAAKRLEEIEKRAKMIREELERGQRRIGANANGIMGESGVLAGSLSEDEQIARAVELLDLEKEREAILGRQAEKLKDEEEISEIIVHTRERSKELEKAYQDALDRTRKKKEQEQALLEQEIERYRKLGDPVRAYREQLLRINELMVLMKDDPAALADLEQAWLRIAEAASKVNEPKDDKEDDEDDRDKTKTFIQDLTEEITSLETAMKQAKTDGIVAMSDAIADMVVSGKADFKSLASAILADIAKMIIKMLILRAVSSFLTGGAADEGGMAVPQAQADSGGRFPVGKPVMIGTGAQPEAFVPTSPGQFIPKQQLQGMFGGGGGVTIGSLNVSLTERQGETSEETAAKIGAAVKKELRGMVVGELQNQQRSGNVLNPAPIKAFR